MVKVTIAVTIDDVECGRDTGKRDVRRTEESGSNCTPSGSVEVW
jgi:hypothetical protein